MTMIPAAGRFEARLAARAAADPDAPLRTLAPFAFAVASGRADLSNRQDPAAVRADAWRSLRITRAAQLAARAEGTAR